MREAALVAALVAVPAPMELLVPILAREAAASTPVPVSFVGPVNELFAFVIVTVLVSTPVRTRLPAPVMGTPSNQLTTPAPAPVRPNSAPAATLMTEVDQTGAAM